MQTQEYLYALGWNIRYQRVKRGLLQQELADACGFAKSAMCCIENGKNIEIATLITICRNLNLQIWQITRVTASWRKRIKRIIKMEEKLKLEKRKQKPKRY